MTAKGAPAILASSLHFESERVNFTIQVGTLHISQRCQLPQQAMLSIRLQVGTARRSTRSFPYRRGLPARDMTIRVHEEVHLPCIAHRDSVTGIYNATHCRVILSTRYEMYGKHGYKTLAWESFPLHDLLPHLLGQSTAKVDRTIAFEILQGVSIDLSVSARLDPVGSAGEVLTCNDLSSPMSLLTEGSDLYSPAATAQSRQLRSFSIDINEKVHEEIDCMNELDLESVFVVAEPSPAEESRRGNRTTQPESAAATSTEEEDSPLGPQYYETVDYSTFLQDEIDLNITDHRVDLAYASPSAAHQQRTHWLVSVGTQTGPPLPLSQDEEEAERLLEEHTAAYLELTQENDMLLQGLILSKVASFLSVSSHLHCAVIICFHRLF